MITLESAVLVRLKKAAYPASYKGMSYYLISKDKENITAYVYVNNKCFESTSDEDKTSETFPLTAEGVSETEKWINQMYESRIDEWKKSPFYR